MRGVRLSLWQLRIYYNYYLLINRHSFRQGCSGCFFSDIIASIIGTINYGAEFAICTVVLLKQPGRGTQSLFFTLRSFGGVILAQALAMVFLFVVWVNIWLRWEKIRWNDSIKAIPESLQSCYAGGGNWNFFVALM